MRNLLAKSWMPPCQMHRIICHWSAGSYDIGDLEKDDYHFIIGKDGRVVPGYLTPADNVDTADGRYASHTYHLNTGSIGVSCAAMGGAVKGDAGKWPLTKVQWETMAQVVAELALEYKIPVSPRTILQHGEVAAQYGIDQGGKWDITWLPWQPGLSSVAVGNQFRDMVSKAMADLAGSNLVKLIVDDIHVGNAQVRDGVTMVPLRKVAEALGCSVNYDAEHKVVSIKKGGKAQ